MESLSQAVSYWEDAIMKMSYLDDQPLPAIAVGLVFCPIIQLLPLSFAGSYPNTFMFH